MSALPSRSSLSGTPTRATANAAMGQQHDFLNERFAAGTATAAEKAASRAALETTRGLQPVTASVASNALTLTLNPTSLEFRSATLGSGTVNMRTVSAAISVAISSGSTLGTTSGVASRVALLAIDNAGTVELAAVNAAGGFHFDESQLISTTAEGGAGAADSAAVVYSTTARSNVPFRFVGFVDSTQTTAGTWATAPSKIQGAGGAVNSPSGSGIVLATAVAASGTSIDFTGIPSWAKRVNLMFLGVSGSGSTTWVLQLGTSSGVETTGYLSSTTSASNVVSSVNSTSGFAIVVTSIAASTVNGKITLDRLTGDTWVASGVLGQSDGAATSLVGGAKTLSAALDRVRFNNNGASWDAGTVNVSWE